MRELDAETLAKYAYLWDGSDPGWVVMIHIQNQSSIRILAPDDGADARFMKTLRSVVPDLAHENPHSLRARINAAGGYDCGVMDGLVAYELRRKLVAAGLRISSEDRTRISHLFVNEHRNSALIIEDDGLACLIGAEAVLRGMPSRHSTN